MRARPSSLSSHSSTLSRLALWAIRFYQRHLSPLKGYSCALRVATGGDSCSAYGYRVIARHGLPLGLPLLRRRLRRCGEVYRDVARAPNPVLHYQRGDCDMIPCDACDLPSPRGIGRCLASEKCGCGCDILGTVLDLLDCGRGQRRSRRQREREYREEGGRL